MDPLLDDLLGTPTPVEPPAGLAARTVAFVKRRCEMLRPRRPCLRTWPGRNVGGTNSVWPRADVLVAAGLLIGVLGVLLPAIATARQTEHVSRHAEQYRTALFAVEDSTPTAGTSVPTPLPISMDGPGTFPAMRGFRATLDAPKPPPSPDSSWAWSGHPFEFAPQSTD